MGMAIQIHKEVRWMCLECWERIVAKPGQPLPFPTLTMTCDECGVQQVHATPVGIGFTPPLRLNESWVPSDVIAMDVNDGQRMSFAAVTLSCAPLNFMVLVSFSPSTSDVSCLTSD